jgi:hypothetical protein
MDAISTAAVTASAAKAATTTAKAVTDAATTAKTATKSFSQLFAAAEKELKTGEKLEKVAGHAFGRIDGGARDQMCLNLSGNKRSGEAFDLVTRNGHSFHVYGSGKDKVSIDMGADAKTATTSTTTTKADTAASTAAGA